MKFSFVIFCLCSFKLIFRFSQCIVDCFVWTQILNDWFWSHHWIMITTTWINYDNLIEEKCMKKWRSSCVMMMFQRSTQSIWMILRTLYIFFIIDADEEKARSFEERERAMRRAIRWRCLKWSVRRRNKRERERMWEVKDEWSTIFSVRDFCKRNDIAHNSWLTMLRAKHWWQKNRWSSSQLRQNFIIESHE